MVLHIVSVTYRLFRALSLDVVLGSLAGMAAAAHIRSVSLPWSVYTLLAATVWLIYTGDHLLDGRRRGPQARMYRHRLHARFFKPLLVLALLDFLLAMYLVVFHLPRELIAPGLVLAACSGVHLLLAQWNRLKAYPKELVIAIIYACGIWLAPVIMSRQPVDPTGILLFVQFGGTAFLNLWLFSIMEAEHDAREAMPAAAQFRSDHRSVFLFALAAIGTVSMGTGALALSLLRNAVQFRWPLTFLLVSAVQILAFFVREPLRARERYRLLCDGAFLLYALPLVFLP